MVYSWLILLKRIYTMVFLYFSVIIRVLCELPHGGIGPCMMFYVIKLLWKMNVLEIIFAIENLVRETFFETVFMMEP